MTRDPFLIDVSDLLGRPGSQRRAVVVAEADFAALQSRLTPGRPVDAELLLECLTDGILVTGEVHYTVHHACNRCLREWDEAGSVWVSQLYGHEPDEDGYRIEEGEVVDLEQLLRDEVTLSFPLAPLCRNDCAGLCPTCGADLNEAPCGGHPEESGSPFVVLKDLFTE